VQYRQVETPADFHPLPPVDAKRRKLCTDISTMSSKGAIGMG
jgi:hypothetical protein